MSKKLGAKVIKKFADSNMKDAVCKCTWWYYQEEVPEKLKKRFK